MKRGESPGGRRFIRNNARGRRPSRGRGRSFVLQNKEISQVQQEILDKENEERNGPVENMAAEIAESSSSEPKPPPRKPYFHCQRISNMEEEIFSRLAGRG